MGEYASRSHNRTAGPHAPLGRLRKWFDDEFLSKGVFQAMNSVGRTVPATIPAMARVATRGLSTRTYTDIPVRTTPADDITLSTASERDSAYMAVHMYRGTSYQRYFTQAERIFVAHEGRPHRGKLHTRDAEHLAAAHPRFHEFPAPRDRLDPDRRFTDPYLRRVPGE
ncbi:hypothetical protein SUDANB51_00653 [Streptomyces sp. enrichment culture]